MYQAEREEKIMNLLDLKKMVKVSELATFFNVSKETIRRDLQSLERKEILKRTHGGAIRNPNNKYSVFSEQSYSTREIQNSKLKEKISKKAATYVENNDLIFVDNSTTTIKLMKYIPKNINVTILTNSVNQLLESIKINNPNYTLIILGGIFRPSNYSVIGSMAVESVKNFKPKKAFISCKGFDLSNGLFDATLYEVETKRAAIEAACETFLLADNTKFNTSGNVSLCKISKISKIITDDLIAEDIKRDYEINGIDIIISDDKIED